MHTVPTCRAHLVIKTVWALPATTRSHRWPGRVGCHFILINRWQRCVFQNLKPSRPMTCRLTFSAVRSTHQWLSTFFRGKNCGYDSFLWKKKMAASIIVPPRFQSLEGETIYAKSPLYIRMRREGGPNSFERGIYWHFPRFLPSFSRLWSSALYLFWIFHQVGWPLSEKRGDPSHIQKCT